MTDAAIATDDVRVLAGMVTGLVVPPTRPRLVGISGYGGSGKSTLAEALAGVLTSAVVVPGDEFLLARPPVGRSEDWEAVDRARLRAQVLDPARRGGEARYQVWDPTAQAPGPWVELAGATTLLVEGLGLFGPDLADLFDLRVWVDVDLATATAQGLWRDEHVYGNPQTELWRDVWRPNDEAFFRKHRPDQAADVLFRPATPRSPGNLRS